MWHVFWSQNIHGKESKFAFFSSYYLSKTIRFMDNNIRTMGNKIGTHDLKHRKLVMKSGIAIIWCTCVFVCVYFK